MKGTGHLKEIEMIVKGKNVNLDISYKIQASFVTQHRRLFRAFSRQPVIVFSSTTMAKLKTATAQIIAGEPLAAFSVLAARILYEIL